MANIEVHALARSRGDQVLQQHNLKEHISLAWKQLRTRGLHSQPRGSSAGLTGMVPRCGIEERASAVFLQSATRPVAVLNRTH